MQWNHYKRFQQLNQLIIVMEKSMSAKRDRKIFYFYFDWPKDVDENLKHKIQFIIKSNESLAGNKIKKQEWAVTFKI